MSYSGSKLFSVVASFIGVPVDQFNFVICQLLALGFAFVYRKHFHPSKTSHMVRHVIASAIGICMGLFCFGRHMVHMFAQAGGCYVLMKWAPAYAMHVCVFVYAMLYLSAMHIYRMIYDYGGYTLDVTLALMISSQKLTSLAFSLHDGLYKKQEALKFDQKQHSVSYLYPVLAIGLGGIFDFMVTLKSSIRLPNPLVFLSYVFCFQGILAGPLCFFNDYISFVEGKNFPIERPLVIDTPTSLKKGETEKRRNKVEELEPEPAVFGKLGAAFACMACTFVLVPIWPKIRNVDKEFIANTGFFQRIWFLLVSVLLSRCRYYFAWKLGDAVNNASGLGYNGYDSKGNQRWDLISNVNILGLEKSTSFKGLVDNWNIQTAVWLKRTCYERAPFSKTLLTYILSAVWHGFYPGYYVCFLSAAFVTMSARTVRRNIRPYFQMTPMMRRFYDAITWFFTQLILAYLVVPFTALELMPTLYFYHFSMYWFMHVGMILILVFLPYKSTRHGGAGTTSHPRAESTSQVTTATRTDTSPLGIQHSEMEEIAKHIDDGVKDTLGVTGSRSSSSGIVFPPKKSIAEFSNLPEAPTFEKTKDV